jgi:hypothetical protein
MSILMKKVKKSSHFFLTFFSGSVNFEKMRMVARVISELQKSQQSVFSFSKNVTLLSLLLHGIPTFSDDELFEMSKKCETGNETTANFRRRLNIWNLREEEQVWKNPLFGKKVPNMRPGAKKRQKH